MQAIANLVILQISFFKFFKLILFLEINARYAMKATINQIIYAMLAQLDVMIVFHQLLALIANLDILYQMEIAFQQKIQINISSSSSSNQCFINHCEQCTSPQSQFFCSTGYYLIALNDNCYSCPHSCSSCISFQSCTSCNDDYTLSNGNCEANYWNTDRKATVIIVSVSLSLLICLVILLYKDCLLYTSPSPRDRQKSRMPSSA
eukprot:TRINITY_DN8364_c0_g1_i1.p2 TRINITY_DN8364_c0_g1~~TRINITY_DN8364_c0_g1_i1.p2  ORF type:complete len:205 (+),score=24.59 TRINITY_DN8364_c0_g1_i1:286-900(+)